MSARQLVVLAVMIVAPNVNIRAQSGQATIDSERQAKLQQIYRNLPSGFEANAGQTDPDVRFFRRRGQSTLFLTANEAVMGFGGSAKPFRMTWVGGNRGSLTEGVDEFPGKSNYLLGNRPEDWHPHVPIYGAVRYRDLYPGIDLVYYNHQERIEFDLVVSPGAHPETIRMGFGASERIAIDKNGDLIVRSGDLRVRFHKPVAYQSTDNQRTLVGIRYERRGSHAVGFALDPYDHARPVIIDPELIYSTYLGGSGNDGGMKVAVDSNGYAYLVGFTYSADFPTVSPKQKNLQGTINAVIAKFNPEAAGTASLLYSTYLGGTGKTFGRGIAVNSMGQIFVAGDTGSPDFPVTTGAYQTSCKMSAGVCSHDVFAAEIDATGSTLLYSTYLGGTGSDYGFNMTIDSAGHMFVTGPTGSSDFPFTAGAMQPTFKGGDPNYGDAFVAEINPAGGGTTDLLYSTFLGGSGAEQPWGIAVDSGGAIYVTGSTTSSNFPVTSSAYVGSYSGAGGLELGDAFVTKLIPAGQGINDLAYSTYLGGIDDDRGEGIAVDAMHNIYVTGFTKSSGFPITTSTAYSSTFGGGTCSDAPCADIFVAKLDPSASGAASLVYSTFFGGSSFDLGHAIALDQSGLVYITGETASLNFPLLNPIQSRCAGGCTPSPFDDVFIAKLDLAQSGTAGLLFSTYLGGSNVDTGWGIAVDSIGNAYVTGQVFSSNFPTMLPLQLSCDGCTSFNSPSPSGDGFLVKVCTTQCPALGPLPGSLPFNSQQVGTSSGSQSITLSNNGNADMTIGSILITGTNPADFPQTNNCPTVLAAQLSCSIQVTFSPTGTGSRSAAVTITDNGGGSNPQSVGLTGTGTEPVVGLSTSSLTFANQIVNTSSAQQPVMVTNNGPGSLTLSIMITGTNAGDYGQTNNCPGTLLVNASCTINVTFTPLNTGTRLAAVTLTDNGVGSPQPVSLTGMSIASNSALRFIPLTPCRVADTRKAAGPFGGPSINGGSSRNFTIPSSACSIPTTALAYSLNVAVVPPGPLGFLTVWPAGQTQPVASTLNSLDGRTKSNAAIIPAGTSGAISVFASNTTDVVLDINGYFVPATTSGALSFYPVTPCRMADTRKATGSLGGPSLVGGQSRTFPILSSTCDLPSTAQAYSLNFAAVPPGPLGFITAYPTGQTKPTAASLNAPTGTTTANAAIVPAGTGGSIDVFASNNTDLVIDVNGYFAPPGTGGLSLYGVTPCRVLDTRKPAGSPPITSMDLNVTASACGIPGTSQGYVLSVAVVPPGPLGFLTLWPQGQTRPTVATLNAVDGAVTSNMAIVPTNNGSISIFASNPTHVVIDISGYFAQ